MDHYIDIRLRPDPEFTPPLLMSALFAKLHRGLVALGSGVVGISFPQVELPETFGLGEHLRLHGTAAELERLMAVNWLVGLRDLTDMSNIRRVPELTKHRCVQRVQAKSSPERLRRRYMKRHGVDEYTARATIPDEVAEQLDLPFVTLNSHSTGQNFLLFIRHAPLQDQPVQGRFSNYGLSPRTTIPWF